MINRRYNITFSVLRPFFRLYNRLAKRLEPVPDPGIPRGTPGLIMANHVTNLDPFFLSTGTARPVFYVASDHIFRWGLISSVIRFLAAPIPIVKSRIDLRTIRKINSIITDGGLVGLFPEGNRSINGLTGQVPPATGKLVRQIKAPLLLYKIHGGYLSSPRWCRFRRRGIIRCELSGMRSAEELSTLTPEQINSVIQNGISVDAFADQRENAVPYKGRKLAEYLERALFICPKCQSLNTLSSQDDLFFCSCGLNVRYNIYGFFEPVDGWSAEQLDKGDFPDSVGVWDLWQRKTLIAMLDQPDIIDPSGQIPIFMDKSETLFNCERASRSVRIDDGAIAMFIDRIEFQGHRLGIQVFPLEKIDRIILHGAQVLQFATSDGGVFELRSKLPRSAYKYVVLNTLLQQKQKGEAYGFFGL